MTHRYIPNTDADVRRMLEAIGVPSIDALFEPVPAAVRLQRELDLPPALSEPDLVAHLGALAAQNADPSTFAVFLGAGAYRHFAPSFIDQLLLRSEFYTAYTPYQPEIAQGTLQAIFEFQTLVAELMGTDLANASMYDGSTAMAEAAMMACRMTKRDRVVVARSVHPHYRDVLATYARNLGLTVVDVGYAPDGTVDEAALAEAAKGAAAVIVGYPNFFGVIEDPRTAVAVAKAAGALTVAVVAEPVAMGLLTPPGSLGVDIVAAELQAFGVPVGYGGPYCGVIAASEKCMRQMPGRFVGMATDTAGPQRVRPHAGHPRAAHPPREGDVEHLHQLGAHGPGGDDVHGRLREAGAAGTGADELRQGALRAGRHPEVRRHGRGDGDASPVRSSTSSRSAGWVTPPPSRRGCSRRASSRACRSGRTTPSWPTRCSCASRN